MHSKLGSWSVRDDCLVLQGDWSRETVAQQWSTLPRSRISMVDMSALSKMDSSFLTLLMSLCVGMEKPTLFGVPPMVSSLLSLYELASFFIIGEMHS